MHLKLLRLIVSSVGKLIYQSDVLTFQMVFLNSNLKFPEINTTVSEANPHTWNIAISITTFVKDLFKREPVCRRSPAN